MLNSKFLSLTVGVATTFALLGADVASANQFVGDLVYCEVGGTKGVYEPDLGDYGIDGVEVQVHCSNRFGGTCDATTTTGAYHASVTENGFANACESFATFDIRDPAARNGRYVVDVTHPSVCPTSSLIFPLTCVVTVNPATLPANCNAVVTPVITPELPADGNADGDYCDAEDGPFAENQILGDNGADPVSCDASASGPPGDGAHEAILGPNFAATRCALFSDFGYETDEAPCVPCIERKHRHGDDRDSDRWHKGKSKHKNYKQTSYRSGSHGHADSDSDSDSNKPDPSGLPYCPDRDHADSDSDSHSKWKSMSSQTTEPTPTVVYCPVEPPPPSHDRCDSDRDSDRDSDSHKKHDRKHKR